MLLAVALAAGLWSGCKSYRPVGVTPLAGAQAIQACPAGALSTVAECVGSESDSTLRSVSDSAGFDELWVIARSSDSQPQAADDSPGCGSLMAQVEGKEVPMPLKHTDVRASVSGYIGSVEVVQQFYNPYSGKIEAV